MITITHKFGPEMGKDKVFGGAERISWQLAEQLTKKGIEVTLVGHNEEGETFDDPFRFVGLPKINYVKRTLNEIKRTSGIVHMGSHNLLYFHRDMWKYKTICHLHEWANLLHMADGKNINYKIFCSEFNKSTWINNRKIPIGPYSVIHSCIDLDEIGEPVYKKYPYPYVLYVGAIALEKGTGEFIRIARLLPKISFVIIGSGSLWGRKDGNFGKELPKNVKWLGALPHDMTLQAMKGASIVVVPSHCGDNCPIVPLEAQACGTPVIASDDGGISELIKSYETGFTMHLTDWSVERFPVGDFAKMIIVLMGDKTLRQKMGRAGRKFVTENFTWEKGIDKYVDVYKKVEG